MQSSGQKEKDGELNSVHNIRCLKKLKNIRKVTLSSGYSGKAGEKNDYYF